MKKSLVALLSVLIFFLSLNTFAEVSPADKALSDKYAQEAHVAFHKEKNSAKCLALLQKSLQANPNNQKALLGEAYLYLYILPKTAANIDIALANLKTAASLGDKWSLIELNHQLASGIGNQSPETILKAKQTLESMLATSSSEDKITILTDLIFVDGNPGNQSLSDLNKAADFANQMKQLKLNTAERQLYAYLSLMLSVAYLEKDYKEYTSQMHYHLIFLEIFYKLTDKHHAQPKPNTDLKSQSFAWMKQASDFGNKTACFTLGDMYLYGYGTTKSFVKSVESKVECEKYEWDPYTSNHKKHLYPFILRVIYFNH